VHLPKTQTRKIKMSNNIICLDLYSWNVNGLRDRLKSTKVRQQMFRESGLYLLQETHELNKRHIEAFNKAVPTCYYKQGAPQTSGVLTSIPQRDPNLTHFPSSINFNDGNNRLLFTKIQWFNLSLLLINIYAPADSNSARAIFFNELREKFSSETLPIILVGDFNCCLSHLDRTRNENTPSQTEDVSSLQQLIDSLDLIDCWRDQHPTDTQYTFGRTLNNKISRLDRFYISSSLLHLVKPNSCQIIPNPHSDHNIVKMTLLAPNGESRNKTYWKFNNRLLDSVNYRQSHEAEIDRILNSKPDDDAFDEAHFIWYEKFKYLTRSLAMNSAIGRAHNIRRQMSIVQNENY